MNTASTTADIAPALASPRPRLDHRHSPVTAIIFAGLLATGLLITAYSLFTDVVATGSDVTTYLPFFLLGVAGGRQEEGPVELHPSSARPV